MKTGARLLRAAPPSGDVGNRIARTPLAPILRKIKIGGRYGSPLSDRIARFCPKADA